MHRTGKSSAGYQSGIKVWRSAGRTGWPVIAALSVAIVTTAGCGNTYRPVVSAINPVGPAQQPVKFAVAISNPTVGGPALVTIVDFAGDTILSTPSILANPSYFTLANNGSEAYVLNSATGRFDSFAVSNPTSLQTSNVAETTLEANLNPVSITPITGTAAGTVIYVPQAGNSTIAALSSSGPSLLQNLSVGSNPNFVVGANGAARVYALNGGVGNPGFAAAIETSTSPAISKTIPVGINPVYGVMSSDLTRAYIVNKGPGTVPGTVSVINVQTNAPDLDNPTEINPTNPPPPAPLVVTVGLNPVWAKMVPALSELLVLNAGDGTTPGSVSVISVPLCNQVTPITNPNCNPANPTDATGFGDVVANVPVGVNPTMFDVLTDGSYAYVVNQSNVSMTCKGNGSVSVVNLSSNQVVATICATPDNGTLNPLVNTTQIYGTPNTISVTSGTPTGKAYVTAPDSKYMTVIQTDINAVDTHISLQGFGVPLPPTGSNQPQSPGVLVTLP